MTIADLCTRWYTMLVLTLFCFRPTTAAPMNHFLSSHARQSHESIPTATSHSDAMVGRGQPNGYHSPSTLSSFSTFLDNKPRTRNEDDMKKWHKAFDEHPAIQHLNHKDMEPLEFEQAIRPLRKKERKAGSSKRFQFEIMNHLGRKGADEQYINDVNQHSQTYLEGLGQKERRERRKRARTLDEQAPDSKKKRRKFTAEELFERRQGKISKTQEDEIARKQKLEAAAFSRRMAAANIKPVSTAKQLELDTRVLIPKEGYNRGLKWEFEYYLRLSPYGPKDVEVAKSLRSAYLLSLRYKRFRVRDGGKKQRKSSQDKKEERRHSTDMQRIHEANGFNSARLPPYHKVPSFLQKFLEPSHQAQVPTGDQKSRLSYAPSSSPSQSHKGHKEPTINHKEDDIFALDQGEWWNQAGALT